MIKILMPCKQLIYIIFLVAVASALTACLSPVKKNPDTKYLVKTAPSYFKKTWKRQASILVALPETRPVYNTQQMAYTIKPYQIAYFGINEWAETPQNMLHPLLVKTLENTHQYSAVLTPSYVGRYHYQLTTQILNFSQNFSHQPATFDLTLRVQLLNMQNYRIIGSKEITVQEVMTCRAPYAGVYAANRAVEKALRQIARFCASKIH